MNQFPLLATGGYFLFFICLYYLDSQLFSELRSETWQKVILNLFNYFTQIFIFYVLLWCGEIYMKTKNNSMLLHQNYSFDVPHTASSFFLARPVCDESTLISFFATACKFFTCFPVRPCKSLWMVASCQCCTLTLPAWVLARPHWQALGPAAPQAGSRQEARGRKLSALQHERRLRTDYQGPADGHWDRQLEKWNFTERPIPQ